ncbi:hypothetical protein B484DRAFT_390919, partial [Ochromonadaceae sp. CCMP2298]
TGAGEIGVGETGAGAGETGAGEALDPQLDLFDPYFDANQLLLTMLTHFAILLTFGAVFPPLAVALGISIAAQYQSSILKVGRFLSAASAQGRWKHVALIDQECRCIMSKPILQQSTWMLVTLGFCFYTLFLFDCLGDAVGFVNSVWVLFVVPSLPLAIYPLHVYLNYTNSIHAPPSHSRTCSAGTEMVSPLQRLKTLPDMEGFKDTGLGLGLGALSGACGEGEGDWDEDGNGGGNGVGNGDVEAGPVHNALHKSAQMAQRARV